MPATNIFYNFVGFRYSVVFPNNNNNKYTRYEHARQNEVSRSSESSPLGNQ